MNMPDEPVVAVKSLHHRFGQRAALTAVSFQLDRGALFALLGPNGSGKTTLFRILTTLIAPTMGSATLDGASIVDAPDGVRRRMGVVFQKPSLDGKLSVLENLRHQGQLYGLGGAHLADRCDDLLKRFGVLDRSGDRVETLSGGLQRRVELAKSLLHAPSVLILDEPSTGLDPGARVAMMDHLRALCDEGVTCLMTTHLMEDADRCDTIGVLHEGRLVALDTPGALKATVGGDVLSLRAADPVILAEHVGNKFGCACQVVDGVVRIERPDGHTFVPELIEAFPGEIDSVTIGKPTLEDVFMHLTGRRLD